MSSIWLCLTRAREGTFCETKTYSWARLSRRTRVTRETNWTLQREEDMPQSGILQLGSCRALGPATPVTTWGPSL